MIELKLYYRKPARNKHPYWNIFNVLELSFLWERILEVGPNLVSALMVLFEGPLYIPVYKKVEAVSRMVQEESLIIDILVSIGRSPSLKCFPSWWAGSSISVIRIRVLLPLSRLIPFTGLPVI